MHELLAKLRLPIGSLVVDLSLVLFVVYSAGQMTERLVAIDRRLVVMEGREITPAADRRLSVVEAHTEQHDREMDAIKRDIVARLERIEQKVDQHIAANGKGH